LNFWSPIGGIGAQFFLRLEILVTNRFQWKSIFLETSVLGLQMGFIGALFLQELGIWGYQPVSLAPCFSKNITHQTH